MAGVRPYHARPFKRPSDLTHVRRQPGGARDPDAAGRQHRLRRLVASPRIPRRQRHHGHRRGRIHWRIRHRHGRRSCAICCCMRAASLGKRALLIANAGTSSTATSVRAGALDFRTRSRRAAGRLAGVRAADSTGSLPAFRSDRRELAHARAAVQRAEPYRCRHVARHRGAPVAPAANRGHQGSRGRGGTCARTGRDLRRELQGAEWRRSHGARCHWRGRRRGHFRDRPTWRRGPWPT